MPLASLKNKSVRHTQSNETEASGDISRSFPSVHSSDVIRLTNSTSVSQRDGVSFGSNQMSHSVMQSRRSNGYAIENNDAALSVDQIEYFLDIPLDIQRDTSADLMTSEDHADKTDWRDWADHFITVDEDTLNANWKDLVDISVPDPDPKVFSIKCLYRID